MKNLLKITTLNILLLISCNLSNDSKKAKIETQIIKKYVPNTGFLHFFKKYEIIPQKVTLTFTQQEKEKYSEYFKNINFNQNNELEFSNSEHLQYIIKSNFEIFLNLFGKLHIDKNTRQILKSMKYSYNEYFDEDFYTKVSRKYLWFEKNKYRYLLSNKNKNINIDHNLTNKKLETCSYNKIVSKYSQYSINEDGGRGKGGRITCTPNALEFTLLSSQDNFKYDIDNINNILISASCCKTDYNCGFDDLYSLDRYKNNISKHSFDVGLTSNFNQVFQKLDELSEKNINEPSALITWNGAESFVIKKINDNNKFKYIIYDSHPRRHININGAHFLFFENRIKAEKYIKNTLGASNGLGDGFNDERALQFSMYEATYLSKNSNKFQEINNYDKLIEDFKIITDRLEREFNIKQKMIELSKNFQKQIITLKFKNNKDKEIVYKTLKRKDGGALDIEQFFRYYYNNNCKFLNKNQLEILRNYNKLLFEKNYPNLFKYLNDTFEENIIQPLYELRVIEFMKHIKDINNSELTSYLLRIIKDKIYDLIKDEKYKLENKDIFTKSETKASEIKIYIKTNKDLLKKYGLDSKIIKYHEILKNPIFRIKEFNDRCSKNQYFN